MDETAPNGLLRIFTKAGASMAERADLADKEALRHVLLVGLGGLGLGAGGAALREVMSNSGSPVQRLPSPALTDSPTYVDMTVAPSPRRKSPVWIRTNSPLREKYKLAAEGGPLTTAADAIWDQGVKPLGLDKVLNMGMQTTVPYAKPWQAGAAAVAGTGGLYGGWHLMNWINRRREKNNQQADTAAAEREYLNAVKELRGVGKMAVLDEAFDKCAVLGLEQPGTAVQNLLGMGANAGVGLPMALGAIPAFGLTYHLVRNAGKNRALQAALYHRQRAQQSKRPASIVLVPEEAAAA